MTQIIQAAKLSLVWIPEEATLKTNGITPTQR